jgi:hypothetical protein
MLSPISASNPHAVTRSHCGNGAQPRDLLLDPRYLGLHKVEMDHQFAQQKSMICVDAFLQSLLQPWNLVSQFPLRHLAMAILLALDQRFPHRPARGSP